MIIRELQCKMARGELTARRFAARYLDTTERIDTHGSAFNAVIELNPNAFAIADSLDTKRGSGQVCGPQHSISTMLKSNNDTALRMMTTAGFLARLGWHATQVNTVALQPRQAGAVTLGKTSSSECILLPLSYHVYAHPLFYLFGGEIPFPSKQYRGEFSRKAHRQPTRLPHAHLGTHPAASRPCRSTMWPLVYPNRIQWMLALAQNSYG